MRDNLLKVIIFEAPGRLPELSRGQAGWPE